MQSWNIILYDKEPEIQLQGKGNEDYVGAFEPPPLKT